ncbi:MAG: hypothetical protein ACRBFS_24120 [Aureispira sp.]
MLPRLSLLLLFLFLAIPLLAQPKPPYAPYGGVFTPKGTLRVLLVFVTYKDGSASNPAFNNKEQQVPDWDVYKERGLPGFINPKTGACPSYLFNKAADFDTLIDSVANNFSKEFYLMSQGQFKMIGDVFCDSTGLPTVVEIDPTGGASWTQMNAKAVIKMQALNPRADWSNFDQRKNHPNFSFDNSKEHGPDNILDYVVFVHRYNKNWRQQPKNSMRSWLGSGGGFAATGVPRNLRLNGYRIAEGFTMNYRSGVFIHEVAHELFNGPHIMGVNNVIGEYFSLMSAGWGVMAPISIFSGFNAWERWYAGFIELVADIKSAQDLKEGNSFVLRDYFTTGDAMRVQIPHSGGQYLWLENHSKQHPLDEHPWKGKVLGKGDTIRGAATGVYAYVEAIESNRHQIFSPLSARANGIQVLHAGGNYDYHYQEELPILKNNWGNKLYSFTKGKENPIDGLNNFYRYPYDGNKNGVIELDKNYNSSRTEGFLPIYREEVYPDSFVNLYGGFGAYDQERSQGYIKPVPFQGGQTLDINSNPKPLNYPRYDYKKAEKQPYFLNGLALEFQEIANSSAMRVTVNFGATDVSESQRWTGNIVLNNLSGDQSADLTLKSCICVLLDQSETPNTHRQTPEGDFTKPTIFRIKKGATLHLEKGAILKVSAHSTLIIEEGAQLILEAKSKLIIRPTGTLVASKESIQQHPRAKVMNQGKREG